MYKITIEKIETVVGNEDEYQKIADTGNKSDGGAVYGYVTREVERRDRTTVLEQEIDELDVKSVIRAINSL